MKNIYLLSFLAFFWMTGFLNAQPGEWELLQEIPSVNLTDICMLDDGMHGFSAGSESDDSGEYLSVFYKTSDGGATWQDYKINLTLTADINGIFFIDENKGWIVGDNGMIITTDNGGETWSYQSSGTGRDIARVQFLDENNGWAAGGWSDGTAYLVLHTSDGGDTWEDLSFGNTAFSCLDLCFIDNQTGWICGHDNQIRPHIHKTTDGGQTWSRQTLPLPAESIGIPSIDFATAEKGWATVTSIYLSPAGAVLQTEDGGDTWSLAFNTNLDYNHLAVKDEMNIAVVSYKVLNGPDEKLFISNDGGSSWNTYDTPIQAYTSGITYKNDIVRISSNNSTILSINESGGDWAWENVSPWLKSVAWQSLDKGWIIAGSAAGTDNFTLYSNDAGETWNQDVNAPGGSKAFWLDEQYGWMLWIGNQARIWRTDDGGETWNSYLIGGTSYLENMFFVSSDIGWVVGSGGAIKKTTNGGMSWTTQSLGVTEFVSDVHFVDENEGWAAGGYGGGNGFIAHTIDGGITWEQQTMAQTDHIQDLYFLDMNYGWATAVGCRVHVTEDGGKNWSLAGQVGDDFADEILMTSPQRGWMITSTAGNTGISFIYQTNDGGNSWAVDYEGGLPFSIVSDLALGRDGSLWACGYHGTILKYSEIVGVNSPKANEFLTISCSPNPLKEFMHLDFHVEESGYADFSLLNLQGLTVQAWESRYFTTGNQYIGLTLDQDVLPGSYILMMKLDNQIYRTVVIVQ